MFTQRPQGSLLSETQATARWLGAASQASVWGMLPSRFWWSQGLPNALDEPNYTSLPHLYTHEPVLPTQLGVVEWVECAQGWVTVDEFVARIASLQHVHLHDM